MGKISFVYAARQYRQASRSVRAQRSPCAAFFVPCPCFLYPPRRCVRPLNGATASAQPQGLGDTSVASSVKKARQRPSPCRLRWSRSAAGSSPAPVALKCLHVQRRCGCHHDCFAPRRAGTISLEQIAGPFPPRRRRRARSPGQPQPESGGQGPRRPLPTAAGPRGPQAPVGVMQPAGHRPRPASLDRVGNDIRSVVEPPGNDWRARRARCP